MGTASEAVKHGYFYGAGAAVNVAVGYIPSHVEIYNVTDGTDYAVGFPGKLLPFSAGTLQPAPGAKVIGLTSGAKGQVKDVIISSGSFAGGNAAGWIVMDADTIVGTFAAENLNFSTDTSGAVDAATTGTVVEDSLYQTAALGLVTGAGATAVTSYIGAPGPAGTPKGFSVGATIAKAGKRYRWVAYR